MKEKWNSCGSTDSIETTFTRNKNPLNPSCTYTNKSEGARTYAHHVRSRYVGRLMIASFRRVTPESP